MPVSVPQARADRQRRRHPNHGSSRSSTFVVARIILASLWKGVRACTDAIVRSSPPGANPGRCTATSPPHAKLHLLSVQRGFYSGRGRASGDAAASCAPTDSKSAAPPPALPRPPFARPRACKSSRLMCSAVVEGLESLMGSTADVLAKLQPWTPRPRTLALAWSTPAQGEEIPKPSTPMGTRCRRGWPAS
ncbi:MAG: hypothetical protein QOD66_1017 [Solirubrobacteraceae bacterium]|nr:hypothetical protein [Solirubrobacteraceae bacterium]